MCAILARVFAESADADAIAQTVKSAGTVPLAAAAAQRAQAALLQLAGGGGARRTGIGNYGAGGFGGSSAASAMDVEEVAAPPVSRPGGGGGGQWAKQAADLEAMGFQREAVLACLEATQGNVEQAIAILTS